MVAGVVVGVLTLLISPVLPVWMGVEEKIRQDASLYFAIICLPMLFRSAIIIFGAVLRAVGDTKTPMLVNVCMNIINIILNYIFIYDTRMIQIAGKNVKMFGFGYGAVGAGIGTAVSFVVGGILMTIALYKNSYVSPKGCKIRPERIILEPCIRVGLPVAMERMATCLGHVVFASLVTGLGTVAFAAHSIALTVEQAFYIPGYGMQTASATLAGNAIGAKDEKRLRINKNAYCYDSCGYDSFRCIAISICTAASVHFYKRTRSNCTWHSGASDGGSFRAYVWCSDYFGRNL